jgi:chromosome segregation ATPase
LLLLGLIVHGQLAARDHALANAQLQIEGLSRSNAALQNELSGVRDEHGRLTTALAGRTSERDNLRALLTALTERETLRANLDAARQRLADDEAAIADLREQVEEASAHAAGIEAVLNIDEQIADAFPRLTRELDVEGSAFSRRDYTGALAAYRRGRVVLNQLLELFSARDEALDRASLISA